MRILPVIGISPKALEQEVSVFGAPNQTVENLLLQYKLFSSIEPTSKSDELGLHFFVTTSETFDKAKDFIIKTVPKIWAKLDNTFLSELPSSVKVPRLTTSNLKDSATTRTAALLANAIESDDATIASKWSNAPKLNRPPHYRCHRQLFRREFPPHGVQQEEPQETHTQKSRGPANGTHSRPSFRLFSPFQSLSHVRRHYLHQRGWRLPVHLAHGVFHVGHEEPVCSHDRNGRPAKDRSPS